MMRFAELGPIAVDALDAAREAITPDTTTGELALVSIAASLIRLSATPETVLRRDDARPL
jgi:hypothetical protein